jgi:hypothetical protein
MFETGTIIFWIVLGIAVSAAPIIFDTYFQKKSALYADQALEGNLSEYNRQIRISAATTLIRRIIWGLFFLSWVVWNFRTVLDDGFSLMAVIAISLGIICFGFGIWGYKKELKRLKDLS